MHQEESRMKRIGTIALLCAAALAGCNRSNTPNDTSRNANRDETSAIGTSGTENSGANANKDAAAADANSRVDSKARQFVLDMLAGGEHEVQLGRLAADHAQSPEVKDFGQMMVRDHTKAGDKLKEIAAQRQIQGPTNLDDDHTKMMDKLSKLQGADFDREYIKAMVDDHEHDVSQLKDRADENKDETGAMPKKADDHFEMQVNQWAADTLPVVRQHLTRAKEISDHIGATMGSKLKKAMPGSNKSS